MVRWTSGALAAVMIFSVGALGNELDREASMTNIRQRAQTLPATVVIRVSDTTKQVEVSHVGEKLSERQLDQLKMDLTFTPVKEGQKYAKNEFSGVAELEKERGQESWYFYWGYRGAYYYPSYWYAGYSYAYAPYYNYWYGGYNYYYYYNPYYYYPYYYRPCCW